MYPSEGVSDMDEYQLLGAIITSVITLGAFVAVILKFTQPINDLRIVIQKLNDNIDSMKADSKQHSERLDKHDAQIDNLDHRVWTIETKFEFYHKDI